MPLLTDKSAELSSCQNSDTTACKILSEQNYADQRTLLENQRRSSPTNLENIIRPIEIVEEPNQAQDKVQKIKVDSDGNQMIVYDAEGNGTATYENGDVCTYDKNGRLIKQIESWQKEEWKLTWDGDRLVRSEGGSKSKNYVFNWNGKNYEATLNGKPIADRGPMESGSFPADRAVTMSDFKYENPQDLEPIVADETSELSSEKWKSFTDAILRGSREELKDAFDQVRDNRGAIDWQYLSERYKQETGRSFDEDARRVLGDTHYSTAKCDFTSGVFPFQDVPRMNAQLPTQEDELRASAMFPEVSAIMNEGDYSKMIANEVRYRDRYDRDKPEGNKTGKRWNKASEEDYADSLYNFGLLGRVAGPRSTSIGPLQMQATNVDQLQVEDKRLASLSPTNRSDAPVFVAAYFERSRQRFEDQTKFDAWLASENAAGHKDAATALVDLRKEYLDAKQRGDKRAMRNALLSTYNPANQGTSQEKANNLDEAYPDPYRRKDVERREAEKKWIEIQRLSGGRRF